LPLPFSFIRWTDILPSHLNGGAYEIPRTLRRCVAARSDDGTALTSHLCTTKQHDGQLNNQPRRGRQTNEKDNADNIGLAGPHAPGSKVVTRWIKSRLTTSADARAHPGGDAHVEAFLAGYDRSGFHTLLLARKISITFASLTIAGEDKAVCGPNPALQWRCKIIATIAKNHNLGFRL
jgi:hypothetical protein